MEHTIDLVFFPNGDKTISSGGQNKFNIEKAKEEYLKCLTNVPQKNKIFLEYYAKNTEYVLNTNLGSAFAYSIKKDVIYYNTFHPEFGNLDFNVVNTHELAHRMDTLNFKSWNNVQFQNAINNSSKIAHQNLDELSIMLKHLDVCHDVFVQDILSALSNGKLDTIFGHSISEWETAHIKEVETFANLFSLEIFNCQEQIQFLNKYFPALFKAYRDIIK